MGNSTRSSSPLIISWFCQIGTRRVQRLSNHGASFAAELGVTIVNDPTWIQNSSSKCSAVTSTSEPCPDHRPPKREFGPIFAPLGAYFLSLIRLRIIETEIQSADWLLPQR